jgi:hypothetical protein
MAQQSFNHGSRLNRFYAKYLGAPDRLTVAYRVSASPVSRT